MKPSTSSNILMSVTGCTFTATLIWQAVQTHFTQETITLNAHTLIAIGFVFLILVIQIFGSVLFVTLPLVETHINTKITRHKSLGFNTRITTSAGWFENLKTQTSSVVAVGFLWWAYGWGTTTTTMTIGITHVVITTFGFPLLTHFLGFGRPWRRNAHPIISNTRGKKWHFGQLHDGLTKHTDKISREHVAKSLYKAMTDAKMEEGTLVFFPPSRIGGDFSLRLTDLEETFWIHVPLVDDKHKAHHNEEAFLSWMDKKTERWTQLQRRTKDDSGAFQIPVNKTKLDLNAHTITLIKQNLTKENRCEPKSGKGRKSHITTTHKSDS